MKIAIVGCGNMGMAFARSFVQYDLVKKEDLLLIEKSKERSEVLKKEKEGVVVDTIGLNLGEVDLVILSVKPQDFSSVAPDLKQYLKDSQVVLSIMAGIPMARIQDELEHQWVVRAMPNTPAMLGQGITGYCAAEGISFQKLQRIDNLINATGRSVYLENESLLDAVTALSGSGPAYFYYLVKHMVQAGMDMGFDEGLARLLVKQTMLGSYHLINNAEKSLDELISAVASKGGTTEAALKTFEERGLGEALQAGILKAEERSRELSKK
ncbi:pyrroline-5-carboxylate reductase [Leadbetterella byssophila DSM 17132]|uniref:Pyrroline-5-carboxylate reductase n=1 Tax=Leadbetterella byssophila (strain DSM 17132 / JCM 16389 / KACC 11308 / NBRC 106382 / 4M15) TaxID=649349 RepID=E4RZK1_LEAB4|nr:pyrroline-5-carboxylate reductase [Leadbetterella byssophila]ADQ17425.1 pyrroline-5-carboxylate reductase [Leadbetterella byssophila DSM 17132]